MDAKVQAIQERLRRQFGTSMVPGQRFEGIPLIIFDEVAGLPTGGESFVKEVIGELKSRGWRIAHVVRTPGDIGSDTDAPADASEADALITVGSDRLRISRAVAPENALDEAMALIKDSYDIVVGQHFGFAIAPRVLMTRRVQEGLNLGLPHVVAYVSDSELDVAIPRFTALDVVAMANFMETTLGLAPAESATQAEPLKETEE